MAEHLDDLLAVDHLLDIAVDPAERLLLLEEVLRGLTAQLFNDLEHDAHAEQYEQRQPYIRHQHADEHRDNGHRRGKHLRHGLAEHLLQRIGIVGEMAHQIAVGMRIEVANRQLLHMREHLVTHLFEHALRNADHQPVVDKRSCNADEIDHRHAHQRMQQTGKHRRCLQQQRRNIVVDQAFEEHGACHVCHSRQQNADEYNHKLYAVALLNIFHKTSERLFRIFAALAAHHASAAAGSAHLRSCHYFSPPFLFCWL